MIHLLSLNYIQIYGFNLNVFLHLAWSYQSSTNPKTSITHHRTLTHPESQTTKSNSKQRAIFPIHKQKQRVLSPSKKEALTFHLHTHHHHHIHNSNSSSLNPTKTTKKSLSPQKSSILVNKKQLVETKPILPLSLNSVEKKEHEQISSTTHDQILNLSINNKTNLNEQNGTIKKTTRRKSSPVKRHISSGTKSNR
jgi:hypothetical protein